MLFLIFIGISFLLNFQPGVDMEEKFVELSLQMIKISPSIFALIGLFEVWVKQETIVNPPSWPQTLIPYNY
ncbi:MAG: hypothetical protein B7C24_05215 [Bacteroidetes bacterium 4572_77]|nr:MAG: hypothetical protein B7C24_05215 [Bacteroidetes bacterium 4572_77]